jgi:hypothetical protein
MDAPILPPARAVTTSSRAMVAQPAPAVVVAPASMSNRRRDEMSIPLTSPTPVAVAPVSAPAAVRPIPGLPLAPPRGSVPPVVEAPIAPSPSSGPSSNSNSSSDASTSAANMGTNGAPSSSDLNFAEQLILQAIQNKTFNYNPSWQSFTGIAYGKGAGTYIYFQGAVQNDGSYFVSWWNTKKLEAGVTIQKAAAGVATSYSGKMLAAVSAQAPCGAMSTHLYFTHVRGAGYSVAFVKLVGGIFKKISIPTMVVSMMLSVGSVAKGDTTIWKEGYEYTPFAVVVDYSTWEAIGADGGTFTTNVFDIAYKLSDDSYKSPYTRLIEQFCALTLQ